MNATLLKVFISIKEVTLLPDFWMVVYVPCVHLVKNSAEKMHWLLSDFFKINFYCILLFAWDILNVIA